MAFGLPGLPGLGAPGSPGQAGQPGQDTVIIDIGTREIKLGDDVIYLENINGGIVVKYAFNSDVRAFIGPGIAQVKEHRIWYKPIEIKPPEAMVTINEFMSADELEPTEAYKIIRGWVEDVLWHPLREVKDAVALYTIYTWFHRFYGKKPFLIVTGFYGTGKSVIGNILKAFGRYTVQTEPGAKTSEWEVALLQGTFLVDEAETLRRRELAKLRRMHDEGYTVSKMMGAPGGWTVITLNLSAPVVLIGTHIPEDPALVSRGLVIRTHYGEPGARPPSPNSPAARELRASLLKMMTLRYKEWLEYIPECERLGREEHDLTMREVDVFAPLCATAKLCRVDSVLGDIALLVKASGYIAVTINPSRRLAVAVAEYIAREGERVGRFYRVEEGALYNVAREIAKAYGMDREAAAYTLRYFYSAGYTEVDKEGRVYIYIYERDLQSLLGYKAVGDKMLRRVLEALSDTS